METVQITCTLKDVPTFLDVYPSELLPTTIHKTGTVIINADPHTREGSHWPAIHLETLLSYASYFDSYGRLPSDPNILSFIKRNASTCAYNSISIQGSTSVVSGQYCCLFARYKDKRITPLMFVRLFPADAADKQAAEMFESTLELFLDHQEGASVASLLS